MVVSSPPPHPLRNKKPRPFQIPLIDLSLERSNTSPLILKACQDLGFFQVENHGIPADIISRLEIEGQDFFSKPAIQKQLAGSPTPFGYGCKNIGFNQDKGDLEYILLEANPRSISERSKTISRYPTKFSCVVNDYIEAVRKLACDILEMVAEGLRVPDKSIFSKLILDANSDSCFRINHYPATAAAADSSLNTPAPRIGFGEHSDPQILTILRSNNVPGLQIQSPDGLTWIPVPPDPHKFSVFVGDTFQALTNGRFVSVRHRAIAPSGNKAARMSMMYFAAPAVDARISPIPQLVSDGNPCRYRDFTWGEFKATAYSLRLADDRLHRFAKQDTHVSNN